MPNKRRWLAWMMVGATTLACALTQAPPPLPTQLAPTPFPPGSAVGGLTAAYRSWASAPSVDGPACQVVWRFEADGRALFAPAVCDEPWDTTATWLNRDNPRMAHGDYAVQGSVIWVRLAQVNPINETVTVRYFTGQVCADGLTLSEPAVRRYSGLPSPTTQPVLTFGRLDAPTPLPVTCTVIPFEMDKRPTITLTDAAITWSVRTHPGEICTLTYTDPSGLTSNTPGTGPVVASANGLCSWTWPVGPHAGDALVTIHVGALTHTFGLEVR